MTVEKEMFLGTDGKQVGIEMIECQMAVNSMGVMQRLERSVDRWLWAGTAARAAAVTMKNEVGGDQVGQSWFVRGGQSHGHKQLHNNLVKCGHMVFMLCELTDRQTKHTHHNTLHTSRKRRNEQNIKRMTVTSVTLWNLPTTLLQLLRLRPETGKVNKLKQLNINYWISYRGRKHTTFSMNICYSVMSSLLNNLFAGYADNFCNADAVLWYGVTGPRPAYWPARLRPSSISDEHGHNIE